MRVSKVDGLERNGIAAAATRGVVVLAERELGSPRAAGWICVVVFSGEDVVERAILHDDHDDVLDRRREGLLVHAVVLAIADERVRGPLAAVVNPRVVFRVRELLAPVLPCRSAEFLGAFDLGFTECFSEHDWSDRLLVL